MKYCIVVPHYKHETLFSAFLPKLITLNLPCIIVDDGSGEESVNTVNSLVQNLRDFYLVKHSVNRGKGAAVMTACHYASALGFTHVLQLDADGQHNVNDVAQLLHYSYEHPDTIISGRPFFDESAPKIRIYGRKITDFWVALETFSFQVKDSLCGFRVYPLHAMEHLIDNYYLGPRMDFDTEVLVKAVWANIALHYIPTKVIYHKQTISHFHYFRDNCMLIRLHVRLMFGMALRLPKLLLFKLRELGK